MLVCDSSSRLLSFFAPTFFHSRLKTQLFYHKYRTIKHPSDWLSDYFLSHIPFCFTSWFFCFSTSFRSRVDTHWTEWSPHDVKLAPRTFVKVSWNSLKRCKLLVIFPPRPYKWRHGDKTKQLCENRKQWRIMAIIASYSNHRVSEIHTS